MTTVRGIVIIEVLIALAVLTSAIAATTMLVLGMPAVLENARLEYAAYAEASALLSGAERIAYETPGAFAERIPVATTTIADFTVSRDISYIYDELAARVTADVAWTDARGMPAQARMETLVTDPTLARDLSCGPFLAGDWTRPEIIATHRLEPGSLLPSGMARGPYGISSLSVLGDAFIVGSELAASTTAPTLFFFELSDTAAQPTFAAAYDTASASRVGAAGIAVGNEHAYAANQFGSASATTCSQGTSCAQLHIYSLSPPQPSFVTSLLLSTETPPYARTTSGRTAGAKSIAYRRGFIYLGLEKTAEGSEFNIIDVRDPENPSWMGGVRIGRSVEAIAVTRTHAHLATSDPANELVIIDIIDPANPIRVGSWNAPGSANFGIGNEVHVRGPHSFFGRTYSNNAAEFAFLDIAEPANIAILTQEDIGTTRSPSGVQGIVVRDFLAAILSDDVVRFWDIGDPGNLKRYAPDIPVIGEGTALTCADNTLFVASTDFDGTGVIQLITASNP